MKQSIPPGMAIGVVVVVLLIGLGWGWSSINNNGESKNPNVGKPSKTAVITHMSRKSADGMTEDTYLQFLKQNRPDLNDAQLKEKADNWWRIKTGSGG